MGNAVRSVKFTVAALGAWSEESRRNIRRAADTHVILTRAVQRLATSIVCSLTAFVAVATAWLFEPKSDERVALTHLCFGLIGLLLLILLNMLVRY